jgi:hypothetical protein
MIDKKIGANVSFRPMRVIVLNSIIMTRAAMAV